MPVDIDLDADYASRTFSPLLYCYRCLAALERLVRCAASQGTTLGPISEPGYVLARSALDSGLRHIPDQILRAKISVRADDMLVQASWGKPLIPHLSRVRVMMTEFHLPVTATWYYATTLRAAYRQVQFLQWGSKESKGYQVRDYSRCLPVTPC